MPTRDISNKRVMFRLGAANAIADLSQPTVAEVTAMLPAHRAIRWDGLDFGIKASDKIDDRTLDDDAAATLRGFMQFGGAVPFFMPKITDTTSILRQVFNLVKVQGTILTVVERTGFADANAAPTAGDNVNAYLVMADGFNPDVEGTGGYAYLQSLIPQGTVWPWTILPNPTPAAVAITGGLTAALTVAGTTRALRGATYQGNNIGVRATWTSSAPAIATVDNRGVISAVSAGTANIVATFPGGTASAPCVVTVS